MQMYFGMWQALISDLLDRECPHGLRQPFKHEATHGICPVQDELMDG